MKNKRNKKTRKRENVEIVEFSVNLKEVEKKRIRERKRESKRRRIRDEWPALKMKIIERMRRRR